MTEDIEELTRQVQQAPDLESRAAILQLDVSAVRRASRRLIAITWAVGIVVAFVVGGVPTIRFLALVAGHPAASNVDVWMLGLLLGVVMTWALFRVSAVILAFVRTVLARRFPTNQTARFLAQDAVAVILVPGIAALPWIWNAPEPLFVYGTIAGAALAARPRRQDYDFVGALGSKGLRAEVLVPRLRSAGVPSTLVGGRSRWLALLVIGNILAWPAGLLLMLSNPWWLVVVVVVSFAKMTVFSILELRGHYRAAVFVQLGTGIALAGLAAFIAGDALWPMVLWIDSAVPA